MQHRRSGAEVFELAMAHARRAVDRAIARTGHAIDLLSYAELEAASLTTDATLNLPEQTRLALMAAVAKLGD